jgi:hypothetical protein
MERRKKRTIFVKTPLIRYDEQTDAAVQTSKEIHCKSTETVPFEELKTFQSSRLIEKMKNQLTNFEILNLEKKFSDFNHFNKNLFHNNDSKIIIRPKIRTFLKIDNQKHLLYRKSSCGNIDRVPSFGSSLTKDEQTQRARRFFMQPCKTPDIRPRKILEELKQKIGNQRKRLFKYRNVN